MSNKNKQNIEIRTVALNERLNQGDIFKDIEFVEFVNQEGEYLKYSKIVFPYAMLLTQDCDLQQDHNLRADLQAWDQEQNKAKQEKEDGKKEPNHDKLLLFATLVPLYNYVDFVDGQHLSGDNINRKMRIIKKGGTEEECIFGNNNARYQYIVFPKVFQIEIENGIHDIRLPNMIMDFKHFFTINMDVLIESRNEKRICSVKELFREDISQRFAYFLSRIGLPNIKSSPTQATG